MIPYVDSVDSSCLSHTTQAQVKSFYAAPCQLHLYNTHMQTVVSMGVLVLAALSVLLGPRTLDLGVLGAKTGLPYHGVT